MTFETSSCRAAPPVEFKALMPRQLSDGRKIFTLRHRLLRKLVKIGYFSGMFSLKFIPIFLIGLLAFGEPQLIDKATLQKALRLYQDVSTLKVSFKETKTLL